MKGDVKKKAVLVALIKKFFLLGIFISLVVFPFVNISEAFGQKYLSPQVPQSPDLFLPYIVRPGRLTSTFGAETNWIDMNLINKANAIPTYWWRYSAFLWNEIEPEDVDPALYNWGAVAEVELATVAQQGYSIVAVVKNTPHFAQLIDDPRNIPCSPIKNDPATVADFVEFIYALAVRYSAPPYNIRFWQLYNEPDVDYNLFGNDLYSAPFGCWGDDADPYYGGEYYAQFLKIFSDTIKAVNPAAKITNGGLLLDCHPINDAPNCPEGNFFEGIIKGLYDHNALDALDYASFHAYTRWYGDLYFDEHWKGFTSQGGTLLGKSYFLREVMSRSPYSINPPKPLLVTESGLMCHPNVSSCSNSLPPAEFSDDQAEYVIRLYVRTIADGIQGAMWFTLNYQPYRHVGLLYADGSPKPAYTAYQYLVSQIGDAQFSSTLSQYYPPFRAYEFTKNSKRIWIIWTPDQSSQSFTLPIGFQSASNHLGAPIFLPPGATTITISSPVYLFLN